jgi:endonuclease/exonuclease/phosphatase family metal-dependent hydrolase
VLALLLLITYLSVFISPATSWIFAFIAFVYPFVLVLNIIFILIWLFFRKWWFLISLTCILIGLNSLKKIFQWPVGRKDPVPMESLLSVLTYNVRLFNYYQWNKDTASWQKIIDFVKKEDPDILCLQEFITLPGTSYDLKNLKNKLAPLSYSHVYYTDRVPRKINFGMATFSKYPIVRKEMIDFEESLNGGIASDIVINNDTVRIYNCHLQSIRLRRDYHDLLDSLIFNYSEKQFDELKYVTVRMKQAYIQRAEQADMVARHIQSSPHPVVICGDFNDTPVSYAYHKIARGLKDAFVASGSGIGRTIHSALPYARIDYILYGPPFRAYRYHAWKTHLSDHFPVSAHFSLGEMADSTGQHSLRKE